MQEWRSLVAFYARSRPRCISWRRTLNSRIDGEKATRNMIEWCKDIEASRDLSVVRHRDTMEPSKSFTVLAHLQVLGSKVSDMW